VEGLAEAYQRHAGPGAPADGYDLYERRRAGELHVYDALNLEGNRAYYLVGNDDLFVFCRPIDPQRRLEIWVI
jgi:hypothetical protein